MSLDAPVLPDRACMGSNVVHLRGSSESIVCSDHGIEVMKKYMWISVSYISDSNHFFKHDIEKKLY